MDMRKFLGNSQAIGAPSVQPNLGTNPGTQVDVGDWTPGFPDTGNNMIMLTTGIYGSTDPDAFVNVITNGPIPPAVQVLYGAPTTAQNNAPQQ